jgi:hypothetical protein
VKCGEWKNWKNDGNDNYMIYMYGQYPHIENGQCAAMVMETYGNDG